MHRVIETEVGDNVLEPRGHSDLLSVQEGLIQVARNLPTLKSGSGGQAVNEAVACCIIPLLSRIATDTYSRSTTKELSIEQENLYSQLKSRC